MDPELLRLIEALDALRECPPANTQESLRLEAIYQSRLDALLARLPNLSRELVESMISRAHARWLKAQAKPTAIPPTA